VAIVGGVSGASSTEKDRPCCSATGPNSRSIASWSSTSGSSLISSVTVPDSTFARSRMSLSSAAGRARGLDDAGVLHLRLGQVLLGVGLQLAGEDQQAVERRAQLV
jgi:hypothetical protein